jgi:hypothetical protein
MRKVLTAALAAATLVGTSIGAGAPANAQGWHGGHWHGGGWQGGHWHGGGYGWGLPLAAGLAGLAVGAALAPGYYPAYGYGYYPAPAYGYSGYPAYGYPSGYPAYGYPGYATCGGRWVWDPYAHRNVWVGQTYAC